MKKEKKRNQLLQVGQPGMIFLMIKSVTIFTRENN